jgi:hypothetical protein
LNDLSVEERQSNGTDFQSQPLEVGNIIGYEGPWNYEEFREFCGATIAISLDLQVWAVALIERSINRGERNLIERVDILLYRKRSTNPIWRRGAVFGQVGR